jgi:uncharacterized lipoprotein YehR (DUF1307 family)
MNKLKSIVVASLSVFVLAGCGEVEVEDLYGNYEIVEAGVGVVKGTDIEVDEEYKGVLSHFKNNKIRILENEFFTTGAYTLEVMKVANPAYKILEETDGSKSLYIYENGNSIAKYTIFSEDRIMGKAKMRRNGSEGLHGFGFFEKQK